MTEFLITGEPIAIGTVLPGVVFPVTGTLDVGPVVYIGTIGTISSPVAISGSVMTSPPAYIGTVGTIGSPIVVATILNQPLVTVQGLVAVSSVWDVGTVGTVQALANLAVASLVGSIGSPIAVAGGTIGTVLSQIAAAVQQQFAGTFLVTNQTLVTSGAATLQMASLQDLVVDYAFGTVLTGSVQACMMDVEEQSGFQTGTIVASSWWAGTFPGGHRLVTPGPLGRFVAACWNLATGGTVGVGTVTQVFITARLSEGP
jgi:hypothetical protein